jgi:uncharacterized membrane protein YeaQ/YmgE (transglycosylase-associated protein family)
MLPACGLCSPRAGYAPGVPLDLALLFRVVILGTLVGVPLYALRTRGRRYAIFASLLLGLALPGALVTQALLSDWIARPWSTLVDAAFAWGALATFAHLVQA